jgi:gliding motility-associated-like protein
LPIINAGTDKYIVHGSSDVMNAMTSDSCLSFEWTPALYLSDATILNPIVTPLLNQQYLLKATSKSGCSSIDTVKVTVLTQIDVPNIFSPNGDGINDTWQIKFLDSYPGATVDVFNRYGQKIYHSNGYSREWDGTLNGVALPIGTYYYVIDPKNKKAVMSGSLTIMR